MASMMLIEDDPIDAQLVRRALYAARVQVDLAVVTSGREALDALFGRVPAAPADRPALILLDLNMPGLTGHDVLQRIKHDKTTRDIPVVVFSSSSAETDIKASYDAAANAYVFKPDNFRELKATLVSMVEFWHVSADN